MLLYHFLIYQWIFSFSIIFFYVYEIQIDWLIYVYEIQIDCVWFQTTKVSHG